MPRCGRSSPPRCWRARPRPPRRPAGRASFHASRSSTRIPRWGPAPGGLRQGILGTGGGGGGPPLSLEGPGGLSLAHRAPPPQAREASARLVATLCERLDGVPETARILVIASTSRTDAVDAALVTPGRLDHLVEVALPDADEQREILELLKTRMERTAGRALFEPVDYRKVLPMMGGMSGADITEILSRALEEKAHHAADGGQASPLSTQDLLEAIDRYKRVRSVVEKIRYGQYL